MYPFALEGSNISKTTDMSVFVEDLKVADESSGRFSLKDTLYLSLSVNFWLLDKYSVSSEGLWNVGLL